MRQPIPLARLASSTFVESWDVQTLFNAVFISLGKELLSFTILPNFNI